MRLLDLSNRETLFGSGLTIYRDAMNPGVADLLSIGAMGLLLDHGVDPRVRTARGFSASPIVPVEDALPLLGEMADELGVEMGMGTLRVNLQEVDGRQAWHKDYVQEPFIAYPNGQGMLELVPTATSIQEARDARLKDEVLSVPIFAGDIALLHIGGEVYHRGCNASDSPRTTLVLH